jgi:hypothetical protein
MVNVNEINKLNMRIYRFGHSNTSTHIHISPPPPPPYTMSRSTKYRVWHELIDENNELRPFDRTKEYKGQIGVSKNPPPPPTVNNTKEMYRTLTPGHKAFVVFAFVNQYDSQAPQHYMNTLASWISRSPLTHVQILFPDTCTTFSVDRTKKICFQEQDRLSYLSTMWVYYAVPTTPDQYGLMLEYCQSQLGAPYDDIGFYTTPLRWWFPFCRPATSLIECFAHRVTTAPSAVTDDSIALTKGLHTFEAVHQIHSDCSENSEYYYTKVPQTCARLALLALVNAGLVKEKKFETSPSPMHVQQYLIKAGASQMYYNSERNIYTWDIPVSAVDEFAAPESTAPGGASLPMDDNNDEGGASDSDYDDTL